MLNYFLKRLVGLAPTLLIVAVLVFLFVHMLPGDPARLAAGQDADLETVELVRKELGLDKPLPEQFVRFFTNIVQGDLGTSIRTRRPVSAEIGERFMPTLLLTLVSMAWSVVFGMTIGITSAVFRNRWPDRLGMTLAVSGISFPAFALGMLLMQIFSVDLGWLPTVGANSWQHYILPSITLGAAVAAVMARVTRASFVEVIQEDFVRTARAKGLRERIVIIKHCLRNALIPVVTMMGLQFGFLLGGSIVVEAVFNWPGLGRLLVDSVNMRGYPVIQALVLLFSLEFILINLVVDMLYRFINPTIRYNSGGHDTDDRRECRHQYCHQRANPLGRILAQVPQAACGRSRPGVRAAAGAGRRAGALDHAVRRRELLRLRHDQHRAVRGPLVRRRPAGPRYLQPHPGRRAHFAGGRLPVGAAGRPGGHCPGAAGRLLRRLVGPHHHADLGRAVRLSGHLAGP